MPYYLKHYFMPDFNHKRIRPVPMADGNTFAHYLGYVQNVVAGQVMAELVYVDTLPEGFHVQGNPNYLAESPSSVAEDGEGGKAFIPLEMDHPVQDPSAATFEEEEQGYWNFLQNINIMDNRFVYENPVFPVGPNCGRDPLNSNRIIALANGYGFYHQGLITVKKLLNVRQDVNFHTGNITFTGDIVVHGNVFPGFSLTGSSLLVKGRLDGGRAKARGNVVAESGIKGTPDASIQAGLTTRLANCERATIITPGNLVVDGNVLHSELFVGGALIIKGRLQGGRAHVGGPVYVKEQIGNMQEAPTRLYLVHSPLDILRAQDLETRQQEQEQIRANLAKLALKGPLFAKDAAPGQELAVRKLEVLKTILTESWQTYTKGTHTIRNARVIVPGTIYPGVEITIEQECHKVLDKQQNIFYALHEGKIVHGSPAITKDWTPPSADAEDDD